MSGTVWTTEALARALEASGSWYVAVLEPGDALPFRGVDGRVRWFVGVPHTLRPPNGAEVRWVELLDPVAFDDGEG
jgi:hypothetical protein